MLADQGGGCAVCGREPTTIRLHVDHNHRTGRIRGLLCWWCNRKLLPGSRDNADMHEAAAEYLRSPPADRTIGWIYVPDKPKRKRKRRTKVGIR